MRIWILRHGKAETYSTSGLDADRPLTQLGHAQARFIADRFLGVSPQNQAASEHDHDDSLFSDLPQVVYSSGAKRAVDTAKTICEVLGLPHEGTRELGLDQPVTDFLDLLRILIGRGETRVMVVGHNPQLTNACAFLESSIKPVTNNPMTNELQTGQIRAYEIDFGSQFMAGDDGDMSVLRLGSSRLMSAV